MNATQKKAQKKAEALTGSKDSSSKYEQDLFRVVNDLDRRKINRKNKARSFKYGYDEALDVVVIGRDGTVGEVLEIQGLKIALPLVPENDVYSRSKETAKQYWEQLKKPRTLDKISSIQVFKNLDEDNKVGYYPYIKEEFRRREEGFWFMNNGTPTYLTGTHYMYLQWAKTDVGAPDFREANRLFYIFWEACKADHRSYGMCYLKNRRSGFSFMSSSEVVNLGTQNRDSRYGILSKTGADAKKMFTDKVVPISSNYPFFFKPIQSGMDKPKTELSYQVPSERISKGKLINLNDDEFKGKGLDTSIDWKNTGDNAYDGEKLKLLVHDESGKWEKPNNIKNNWRVTKTCLRLGKKIIGKCMMGSTSNSLSSGGEEFKELYEKSDLRSVKRNPISGQTPTGLYSLFINAYWNMEGFFDRYGWPVFETPEEPILGVDGEMIDVGVIDYWKAEVEGLKETPDSQNEYYRQFPLTENHAFRDEAPRSLFNLAKIYEQHDYNEDIKRDGIVMEGNFQWNNGVQDTFVRWFPTEVGQKTGRFRVTWIPPERMRNQFMIKNSLKYPANEHLGAFGCDPYDISGVVGGGGSNGALHGVTGFHMEPGAPTNRFFLEYISRPPTAEIFFEDVLMACVFYSMPILAENNKPRLLYHFARRGYRGYSMSRPDRRWNELSQTEKELGGIPNTSEAVKQAHAAAIQTYIEDYVGITENGEMGQMYFQKTLEDWARFDITKRTLHDASISSGLAIMAIQKNIYKPSVKKQYKSLDLKIKKYNNSGSRSTLIN